MNASRISALLIAVGVGVWAANAAADPITVSIGVSTTLAGAPGTVQTANSNVGVNGYQATIGGISFKASANGVGDPTIISPLLLFGSAVNASSEGGGDAYIFFTEQNLTTPFGDLQFGTKFNDLLLPTGWTATVTSYLDQSNAQFGLATGLTDPSGLVITQEGAALSTAQFVAGVTGPYSITEVLHIVATGQGTSSEQLSIAAPVPGPIVGAGLPGLIAACTGLLALARRRRRVQAAV